MGEMLRELRDDLAALVLPVGCAGCGLPRVRGLLCEGCGGVLRGAVPRRLWPSPVPPGLPAVYGALRYADEVRAVLLAHKERGALRLAGPLGAVLAGSVRAVLRGACRGSTAGAGPPSSRAGLALVPVPSARRAVAGRGHDPVRRIALAAARELRREGVPAHVLSVLRQRRRVADQAGLDAGARSANLSGALHVAPGGARLLVEGVTVLVDDLMTTGASLVEAARAVAAEGAVVAGAAVVAARSEE